MKFKTLKLIVESSSYIPFWIDPTGKMIKSDVANSHWSEDETHKYLLLKNFPNAGQLNQSGIVQLALYKGWVRGLDLYINGRKLVEIKYDWNIIGEELINKVMPKPH